MRLSALIDRALIGHLIANRIRGIRRPGGNGRAVGSLRRYGIAVRGYIAGGIERADGERILRVGGQACHDIVRRAAGYGGHERTVAVDAVACHADVVSRRIPHQRDAGGCRRSHDMQTARGGRGFRINRHGRRRRAHGIAGGRHVAGGIHRSHREGIGGVRDEPAHRIAQRGA